MAPSTIARFLRTVRHLKWSQLLWRLRYRLGRRAVGARRPAAGTEQVDIPKVPVFRPPGTNGFDLTGLAERGEFEHLNLKRPLGSERPDWCLGPLVQDRLWAITLHYHGWAYALADIAAAGSEGGERAAALFRRYVSDWIESCDVDAPGALELAWNPFAVATRLGWWARVWARAEERLFGSDVPLRKAFLESMWRQAAFLHGNIEWDLRGNHLLRDAVGLAWAGSFFQGPAPARWLRAATGLASGQAREQVLADGAHFERSPMYHVQVMEDVLSLALLLEDADAAALMRETWRRMAEYLVWMRHPDGGIPLFNDAALNGACSPEDMLGYAGLVGEEVDKALPSGGRLFPDAGMIVFHGAPWSVFFDVGPVGVDYQPGHAHADTLSVECSYAGSRLFVDPGTHGYDNDERRRYDRSTAAHNTVCVDGRDSSEVWHIFRVGRRARPADVRCDAGDEGLVASAAHDGYRYLPGRPLHRRELTVERSGAIRIADCVSGRRRHLVEGGLLVGPGWKVEDLPDGWRLSDPANSVRVRVKGPEGLALRTDSRPYHPEFGLELERPRLTWSVRAVPPLEIVTEMAGD